MAAGGALLVAAYLVPITATTIAVAYPTIHFFGFLLLSTYLFRIWRSTRARIGNAVLLSAASVLLQIIQQITPGRQFNLLPILYNMAGVALGVLLVGNPARKFAGSLISCVVQARSRRFSKGRSMRGDKSMAVHASAHSGPHRFLSRLLDLLDALNVNTEIKVATFFDASLQGPLLDGNVLQLARTGYIEYGVTQLLLQKLRSGSVFIDVGAHIGYFSALAASLVGPNGRVIAFEPTPRTYEWLAANLAGMPNVVTENQAIMDRTGVMGLTTFSDRFCSYNSFFQPRTTHQPTGLIQNVRTTSLDEYLLPRGITPDLVKIDAESSEMLVLRGMRDLLRSASPTVVLELGDISGALAPASSMEIVTYLESMDYHPYEVASGVLVPHQKQVSYPYCQMAFVRALRSAR